MTEKSQKTRVVILGGGFGGLYAAMHFDKAIAGDSSIEVTLVDRENFIVFTPMLHEVASGDLNSADIVNPIRKMLKRVQFLRAEVKAIDLHARRVTASHGLLGEVVELEYDHLLLALGSETNFFGLPGVAEVAMTMKSVGDAFFLRNQMIALMEEATLEEDESIRRKLLTFVVAGGGFAGTETVGAINDLAREAVRRYPKLSENLVRVVLVHPNAVILPELGEKLGRYAQKKLAERKVEVLLNTRVLGYSERGVELSEHGPIPTLMLVWTAGVTPSAAVKDLPCAKQKGRVVVDVNLETPEFHGVWAVGDCASVPNPRTGTPHPPTAQHAIREAKQAAKNILAAIRGEPKKPFSFTTIGLLAAIGHRAGVANVFGMNFSGFLAWWLWRSIYLSKLPRLEKKLQVAAGWTLDLFFRRDIVQYLNKNDIEFLNRRLIAIRRYAITLKKGVEAVPNHEFAKVK
jgi:NADH dehydrogenase